MKKVILILALAPLFVQAQSSWTQGGDLVIPPNQPILGTNNNRPLRVNTNDTEREKLNGNVSYGINGYPASSKNGYLLLGYSGTFSNSLFTGSKEGAFSLLHLNGAQGTFVQQDGYKPWMKTGVTYTDNYDLGYTGIYQVRTSVDF